MFNELSFDKTSFLFQSSSRGPTRASGRADFGPRDTCWFTVYCTFSQPWQCDEKADISDHHWDCEHWLFVGNHDDEDGRDAAQDDDDGQSQQSSLGVAHSLSGLLHAGHDVRRSDLKDAPSLAEVRLEFFVDFQHVPIEESKIEHEKDSR